MATYDLNQILKTKSFGSAPKDDGELRLDDVARVKVLSPGRQVLKRFVRNRLAVFGTILLVVMFVFSFIGPLFYAYGQKQIFYKYDSQNVNYAMARENTAYNGYDINEEISVERPVLNAMNSNIRRMTQQEQTTLTVFGEESAYQIRRLADDIYELDAAELTQVCSIGSGTVRVGVYSDVAKTIDYAIPEIDGLLEAVQENLRNESFPHEGVTYHLERGAAKTYTITMQQEGLRYTGPEMDAGFESALERAAVNGDDFTYRNQDYVMEPQGGTYAVYRVGRLAPVKVYTRLTVDTFEVGAPVSDDLMVGALLYAERGGSVNDGGVTYTVRQAEGTTIIYDADGNEYAELTPFTVRRYSGEDTVAYDLKKVIAATVEEMEAAGIKSTTITYDLPQQTETGEYNYDENGNLLTQETEMLITQQDTGEYVINCDQIIYVIDMFAAPSLRHILGTDGDGFDVLARIMYGGRISLMVGFVVVFLEIFLGVIMGGLAGYYGGWVDNVIMRLVDVFYCLPSLPIMIILGAMMDALRMDTYIRLMIMMAALGIMGWASVARMVRGQILSLREQEFMVAAEAAGVKVRHRIFRHLVPNVMPQLIVIATMGMGSVILTESTLSYLGLGVKHPLATWGTIINSVSSASAMSHYAHIWIPVGLLICLTVIAFNFVGDGLRDAYDPKSKR